jgi:AraC family transcriptional regulator
MDEPRWIELEAQPALVIAAEAEPELIWETFARLLPRVVEYAGIFGPVVAGAPFLRYLGLGEQGRLKIEAGVPTLVALPGSDEIRDVVVPGGKAVSLTHIGPYDGLAEAHLAIDEWMEDRHSTPLAPRTESYLSGPGDEPDPARWRTLVSQITEV